MHFGKLPKCTRFQTSHNKSCAKAMVLPVLMDQVAVTDCPWDDGISMDQLDDAPTTTGQAHIPNLPTTMLL
jgi:hypothetical protein